MLRRVLAYLLAGAPAAVGIGFVARYGYVTSDTTADGIATAFLLGMIAAGAFGGPAVVVAVAGNGRRRAAGALGVLTCLAILANWSHTLGAIAHRTSGSEAESAKASAAIADARTELARIAAERKALPAFVPATAETVAAAKRAADTATKIREAECDKRGPNCRQRELDEQAAADKLATATTNKAATDRAAKLDADAAAIRAQLANAPAVKDANPLGSALARMLPWLPAASAATYQQAIISLIAELLIAAGLALPELLRRAPDAAPPGRSASLAAVSCQGDTMAPGPAGASQRAAVAVSAVGTRRGAASIAGVPLAELPKPETVGSVGRFMLACLPRTRGKEAALSAVYARYRRWCTESAPASAALSAGEFAAEFRPLADRVGLHIEKRGERLFVCDVRLAA
jgi:hypothetical protein